MKARVQYNDYVGTVAADIADEYVSSMDEYLSAKSKSFDRNKYHCIGCELRLFGNNKVDVVFFCRDMSSNLVIPMRFNKMLNLSELSIMFKRLDIVMGEDIENFDDPQVDVFPLD